MADQTKDCFIGISSIPDSLNQYRLGTIFLRNFYTALDFDKNLIMIGLNKGSDALASSISGKVEDPWKRGDEVLVHYYILGIILGASLLLIIIFLVYKAKT
jgi:hypothetical protein